MPSIRVLLGALPPALRAAVSAAIDGRADMVVVGVETRPSELLWAAGELRADVVVVAAAAGELPGVATHLLDQHPDLRVLAVAGTGTAWCYRLRPRLDEVRCRTAAEMGAAIRAEGGDEEWRTSC